MDPLTIGFEDAFHEANAGGAGASTPAAALAEALRAVVDASPHRASPVSISAASDVEVVIRRGEERLVLARKSDGWQWLDSRDPSRSGPLAASLTEWLIR